MNSSDRLFNNKLFLFFIILNFSSRQKLHYLEPALWTGTFLSSDHVMENGLLVAFNFHTCLDSSVSVEYFLLVNDLAWVLYLVLMTLIFASRKN